jgi:hypothetical protein
MSATRTFAPHWRRRLALIAGTVGLLLLSMVFVSLPVAASSGHDGGGGVTPPCPHT